MKLIAHRGLINGPDSSQENSPQRIVASLNQGYDCEVDLRVIDNQPYLGHDRPDYKVDKNFLYNKGLWIHCKNFEALAWCQDQNCNLHYFWHDTDHYTLTSRSWIWSYPGMPASAYTVVVLPEWNDPELKNLNLNCYGICSDYVEKIKGMLNPLCLIS